MLDLYYSQFLQIINFYLLLILSISTFQNSILKEKLSIDWYNHFMKLYFIHKYSIQISKQYKILSFNFH